MQDKPKRPLDQNDDEIFNEMFSVASSHGMHGPDPLGPYDGCRRRFLYRFV